MFSTGRPNEKRAAFVLAALLLAAPALAQNSADACGPIASARATGVVEAVDARLDITLADGRRLRLAGVTPAPSASHAALAQAGVRDLATWTVGEPVAFSTPGAGEDRWGRAAARITLAGAEAPTLAVALLDAGWGRVDPDSESRPCLDDLYRAEDRARRAGRGLWGDPMFAVLDAARPELFADRAGWVIIEGVVVSQGAGRLRTFINLGVRSGADRPRAPSLVLSRRAVKALEAAGLAPGRLVGKRVRARGLLDTRFGPRLELDRPEALEIVLAH